MAINPMALLGGVGVVALGVVGGLYATGTGTSAEQELVWHSLSEDSDYSTKITATTGEYHNKYGQTYSKYFVGVTTKNGDATKNNSEWWKRSFKNNYSKTEGDKSGFKDIDNETKLKDACANAYKAETTSIKTGDSAAEQETTFKEIDVWKFCSPLGKKPTAIKDGDGYTNQAIGAGSEKTNLISVKDEENNKFWKLKQKLFFEGTTPTDSEKFFKSLYSKKDSTTNPLALKAKCGQAYLKDPSSNPTEETDTTAAEVKKYCSL